MIGRTISHYEIVSQIGAGGMGTVYRARDTLLGRFVAIKVLPAEAMKDESRQRRFLQEARAASALNHPSIITIYDVLHEDDVHAIVMELLEGQSLQARLVEGPLPPRQAVRIARQIADALAAAHAAGIIHRDLKPANVMLTERGVAKVLDFGIAKLDPMRATDQDATQTGALTMMGAVVGTAAYMSPEQARGEAVDGRSDIFSLGIVMYEMLSGKSPFAASTITGVLHKLIYEDPADLASHAPDLPAGLSPTIERALAKNPGERFGTMDSLVAVLEDIDVGRSTVELRGPVFHDRPSRPGRARLAAAIVIVLALAAVGFRGWQAGWWTGSRADPVEPTLAVDLPATADEAYRLGERLLERYDKDGYVDRSIASFRRALDLRPDYAAAHAGLGLAYWRKYREARDRMWLDYAHTNATRAVTLAPQLTAGLIAAAYVGVERGELDGAQRSIDEALVLDPRSADALASRAYLRLQQRRTPEALASVREAGRVRPDDWSLPLMEGVILMGSGAAADAVAPLERAVALAPDSPLVLRNLGAAYHAIDRPEDATRAFQNALEIKQDPAVYNNLGTVFFYRGLYDQAMRAFESATRLRGNDFRMWNSLADTYRLIPGRSGDATQAYTRALQLVDEGLARTPDNLELTTRRILMLAKRGDCAGAITASGAADLARATPTEEFRVAAAWEVCRDRERALATLTHAISRGYPIEQVRRDPDLVQLRDDERFHKFLAGPGLPGAPPRRR